MKEGEIKNRKYKTKQKIIEHRCNNFFFMNSRMLFPKLLDEKLLIPFVF